MTTELAAGTALSDARYRLERRLGAGGMASVWLAHDSRLDRPVAVKLISDVLAADPAYVERFRREARVAAGLAHPNLVTVYDFGDDPRPFLVMELVDGGTLADRLKDGRADVDVEALARDLLGALGHIHAARIVHRDIKPANVLIGRDGRPRLTDFGIAQPEDATRLTQTGNVLGTLRYLAPEVVRGAPATARSDLFALGVLLGECLGQQAPPRLAALVRGLTEDDPARRPASADEALAALDERPDAPRAETVTSAPALTQRLDALTTRVLGGGREPAALSRRPQAALLAAAALLALVLAIAGMTGDGDGDAAAPRFEPAPPDAPLERQLDALDRAVRDAAGR